MVPGEREGKEFTVFALLSPTFTSSLSDFLGWTKKVYLGALFILTWYGLLSGLQASFEYQKGKYGKLTTDFENLEFWSLSQLSFPPLIFRVLR